ncbi:MAG: glycosyltransferase family 2 protein [Thermodesulfovibrionales bacterium]
MRTIGLLSLVIPCHNEEEVLHATHRRLTAVMAGLREKSLISDYELLFVDNGSTDRTLEVMHELFSSDVHVRLIVLRKNFLFQGSLSAGLFHARGDAVVTIDADLQDPPEKIEEMARFYQDGYDLVLGIRDDRRADSFLKRFFSETYYRIMKAMGVTIVFNHGDFRLMSSTLLSAFNRLPERNRFIRALILQLESKYATVSYPRAPRTAGRSKFGVRSLLSLSLDSIVSFTYVPLRLASLAGFISSFIAVGMTFWVLYSKFISGLIVPGWASILLPVLGIGGLQLFALGIIGEYIGRLYIEVKQRPLFLVREQYDHHDGKRPVAGKGE